MYKILGNLCLLISAPIFALTTASVNQTWFYPGDQVVLTLSSDGNKVSFPSIGNIMETIFCILAIPRKSALLITSNLGTAVSLTLFSLQRVLAFRLIRSSWMEASKPPNRLK